MSDLFGIPLRGLKAQGDDWTSLLGSTERARAKQGLRTAFESPQPTRKVTFEAMTRTRQSFYRNPETASALWRTSTSNSIDPLASHR